MPDENSAVREGGPEVAPASAPERRKKALLWAAGLLLVLYYNLDLLTMALHTVIPFCALAAVGLLLALLFPRTARTACSWAFGLLAAAVVLRRASTLHEPLAQVLFGGVLAMGGYPPWAAWLVWLLRLGSYLLALRLGAHLGLRLRPPAPEVSP